jgi:thermostable 8-oxoguanine DNA glycosylase
LPKGGISPLWKRGVRGDFSDRCTYYSETVYKIQTEVKPFVTTREEEIRENIRVFDKLTPSQKLRRIEQERRRLKYVRTLVTRWPSHNESRESR